VTFYIDENLPPRLARIWQGFDRRHTVMSFRDLGWNEQKDSDWIATCAGAREAPVIVSADRGLLSRSGELNAVRESGLTFFLAAKGFGNARRDVLLPALAAAWPEMIRAAQAAAEPAIYLIRLRKPGSVIRRLAATADAPAGS